MNQTTTAVTCKECGASLAESSSLAPEQRKPCAACGSIARHVHVHVFDTGLTLHESLAVKARHPGDKRPFREGKYGESLNRATGKWNHREMTIDRENNSYREVIADTETGQVIHEVDEPLDEHRGTDLQRERAADAMRNSVRRVVFATEAGSPTVGEDVAIRMRDALRGQIKGPFHRRALSAANAIDAGLLSDGVVKLEHAEQLAAIEVLEKWEPLEAELIALAAALRQAPSLTHQIGYAPDEDPLDRLPNLS